MRFPYGLHLVQTTNPPAPHSREVLDQDCMYLANLPPEEGRERSRRSNDLASARVCRCGSRGGCEDSGCIPPKRVHHQDKVVYVIAFDQALAVFNELLGGGFVVEPPIQACSLKQQFVMSLQALCN